MWRKLKDWYNSFDKEELLFFKAIGILVGLFLMPGAIPIAIAWIIFKLERNKDKKDEKSY